LYLFPLAPLCVLVGCMGLLLDSGTALRYCSSVTLLLITLLIKWGVTFMVSERSFLRSVDLDVRLAFSVSSGCS